MGHSLLLCLLPCTFIVGSCWISLFHGDFCISSVIKYTDNISLSVEVRFINCLFTYSVFQFNSVLSQSSILIRYSRKTSILMVMRIPSHISWKLWRHTDKTAFYIAWFCLIYKQYTYFISWKVAMATINWRLGWKQTYWLLVVYLSS